MITKSCIQCQTIFNLTEEDLKFYDKVSPVFQNKKYSIPPPSLCPACRRQRRLAFRNERKLYNRKCDITGKQIISMYSPDKPYKVYDQQEWWSDKWDPLYYGKEFDFNKPFFQQFHELMLQVPRLSLFNVNSQNSEYNNYNLHLKNCYLTFGGGYNEDCYYSNTLLYCKDCCDSFYCDHCELCYECIDCNGCYHLLESKNCISCRDSLFLFDCKQCEHCIGCYNLRNKTYCYFNKQLDKKTYEKQLFKILASQKSLRSFSKYFHEQVIKNAIHRFYQGENNENITGDDIYNSKNIFDSFNVYKSEDLHFAEKSVQQKNSADCLGTSFGELTYESIYNDYNYHTAFILSCEHISNMLYCDSCFHSQNCFGCIGLKRNQYCILNKQYTKEEYETLVPKIIEHMKRTPLAPLPPRRTGDRGEQTSPPVKGDLGGYEWGQFFPPSLSPFGYNETVANEYFPLSKEDALKLGAKWKDDDISNRYEGPKIDIPEKIQNVQDSITKQILTCQTCQKNYKIIMQELGFYRTMQVPVPTNCPDCRHKNRMALRNPRKLWNRTCMKCGIDIKTTYAPDRKEIVYCEECYNKSIY